MSKIQRIEDLEREVDQLHVVLGRLSDRLAVLENAPGPVKVPTLPEQVTLPPPPPDPAVVVADALRAAWGDDTTTESALRDLFAPEALAQAAAKVQEAES